MSIKIAGTSALNGYSVSGRTDWDLTNGFRGTFGFWIRAWDIDNDIYPSGGWFPLMTFSTDRTANSRATHYLGLISRAGTGQLALAAGQKGELNNFDASLDITLERGKWYYVCFRVKFWSPTFLVYDIEGNKLSTSNAEGSFSSDMDGFSIFTEGYSLSTPSTSYSPMVVDELLIHKPHLYKGELADATVSQLAASLSPPTVNAANLQMYWDTDTDFVTGSGIIPNTGTMSSLASDDIVAPASWEWTAESPDNPVKITNTTVHHNGHTLELTSKPAGKAYVIAMPSGDPLISDADILSLTASGTCVFVGSVDMGVTSTVSISTSGGASRTAYDYYLAYSTDGGTSLTFKSVPFPFTTCGYAELSLTDVAGSPLPNLTDISWFWFDDTDATSTTSATDFGIIETTDGTGKCIVDLVNSSLTLGQTGALTLHLPSETPPHSGMYFLEVK